MLEGQLILKSVTLRNSCVLASKYWFSDIIDGVHKKRAVSDRNISELVRFDTKKYREILLEEELANSDEKVDFLSRYCPLF